MKNSIKLTMQKLEKSSVRDKFIDDELLVLGVVERDNLDKVFVAATCLSEQLHLLDKLLLAQLILSCLPFLLLSLPSLASLSLSWRVQPEHLCATVEPIYRRFSPARTVPLRRLGPATRKAYGILRCKHRKALFENRCVKQIR